MRGRSSNSEAALLCEGGGRLRALEKFFIFNFFVLFRSSVFQSVGFKILKEKKKKFILCTATLPIIKSGVASLNPTRQGNSKNKNEAVPPVCDHLLLPVERRNFSEHVTTQSATGILFYINFLFLSNSNFRIFPIRNVNCARLMLMWPTKIDQQSYYHIWFFLFFFKPQALAMAQVRHLTAAFLAVALLFCCGSVTARVYQTDDAIIVEGKSHSFF